MPRSPSLHHVAICVTDLDKAMALYVDGLGLVLDRVEDVPGRGIRVAFLRLGDAHVELIQPTRDDSEVSAFMAKRGEGLHHVALSVGSLDEAMAAAKSSGGREIPEASGVGAGGRPVAFLHPRTTHGVLIELVESP